MSIESRLSQIEKRRGDRGACPKCRPFVVCADQYPDADPEPPSCDSCGRPRPMIRQRIVEVVVEVSGALP